MSAPTFCRHIDCDCPTRLELAREAQHDREYEPGRVQTNAEWFAEIRQRRRELGTPDVVCTHRYLDHPDGMTCTRTDPHEVGHVYKSSAASDLGEGSHHAKEPNDE